MSRAGRIERRSSSTYSVTDAISTFQRSLADQSDLGGVYVHPGNRQPARAGRMNVVDTTKHSGAVVLPPSSQIGDKISIIAYGTNEVFAFCPDGYSLIAPGSPTYDTVHGYTMRSYVRVNERSFIAESSGAYPAYTPRAKNVGGPDINQTDMTSGSGVWNNWDISSIIGSQRMVAANIRMRITDGSVNNSLSVRRKGDVSQYNMHTVGILVANDIHHGQAVVQTDELGVLQVNLWEDATSAYCHLVGWWEVSL